MHAASYSFRLWGLLAANQAPLLLLLLLLSCTYTLLLLLLLLLLLQLGLDWQELKKGMQRIMQQEVTAKEEVRRGVYIQLLLPLSCTSQLAS